MAATAYLLLFTTYMDIVKVGLNLHIEVETLTMNILYSLDVVACVVNHTRCQTEMHIYRTGWGPMGSQRKLQEVVEY